MSRHDPIEDTPEYKAIEAELEARILAEAGPDFGLGYCRVYWAAKKRILLRDYGIDWESPDERHPTLRFD